MEYIEELKQAISHLKEILARKPRGKMIVMDSVPHDIVQVLDQIAGTGLDMSDVVVLVNQIYDPRPSINELRDEIDRMMVKMSYVEDCDYELEIPPDPDTTGVIKLGLGIRIDPISINREKVRCRDPTPAG